MNESNQKKNLLLIISILIIANCVTCVMLVKKSGYKAKATRHQTMTTYLKDEIGFNDAQMASYDSMHVLHLQRKETIIRTMHSEKEARFNDLAAGEFNDSLIALAANSISEKQKSLEVVMLKHLREVRAIANAEQRAKFDSTFIKYMGRQMKKKQDKVKR